MNECLDEALPSVGVNYLDPGTNIIVCESPEVSGQFVTTELLCKHLSSDRHVLFVSLHHTFAHYCNVAAKRGIKLLSHYKSGKMKVIEGQMLMTEAAAQALEGQDISKHPFNFMFNNEDKSLKNLFLSVKFCVDAWRSAGESFVIFIDHLSVLLSLGISCTEARIFVQYCTSLNSFLKSVEESIGSLVVLMLDDPSDNETQLLAKHLSQWFNATLSVKPLSTGRTSNVDGSLHICSWPQGKYGNLIKKEYLFKVFDKTTKLFAPGMTATML